MRATVVFIHAYAYIHLHAAYSIVYLCHKPIEYLTLYFLASDSVNDIQRGRNEKEIRKRREKG